MRHAQSKYNIAKESWKKEHGEQEDDEYKKNVEFKKSEEYYDADLTDKGIEESRSAQDKICEYKDIKYVFVSPMVRTCHTAREALGKYKKAPIWKFLPLIHEKVDCTCNIAVKTDQVRKQYPEIEAPKELDDKAWFLKDLVILEEENKYAEQAAEKFEKSGWNPDSLMDFMWEIRPDYLENQKQMRARIFKAREFLLNFVKEKKESGEELKDNQILVVAHLTALEYFTANGYKDDGEPYGGEDFDNAEVVEFELKPENK